jgi:outer membrane protein TolC
MNTLMAALAALAVAQAPLPPPAGIQAQVRDSAAPPAAQASAPAGATLTLEAALRRAGEANLDLKVAQARLEQARAGVWKAWSYHLPQVSAGASATRNNEAASLTLPVAYTVRERSGPAGSKDNPDDPAGLPGLPTSYFATPTYSVDATIQALNQFGAQVQVNQALFAPQLWFAIRAAYQGAGVAEQSVEQARRDILFGVAQAYYGVASLKKLVRISEELLGIAERQEKDAQVRLDAGTIPKVGALRGQIDRTRAEQDLLRARNAYESARIGLSTLLDRDTAFEVEEPPEPPLPDALDGLEARALQLRPDVLAARYAEGAATNLRRSTTMQYLPSVGAFGRYQVSNVGGFTGKDYAWAVGLAATWNIFDGGLREATLRENGAKVAEAEAARRGAEIRATAEVRQALLDLGSARANAVKSKEQARLAQENQRLVDISFKAGAATAVELADATAQLRAAAIGATADELAARLAAIKLHKVSGTYDPVPARAR